MHLKKPSRKKNLSHITSNRTRFKSEAKLISGSVAERFKAAVLKTAVGVYSKDGEEAKSCIREVFKIH